MTSTAADAMLGELVTARPMLATTLDRLGLDYLTRRILAMTGQSS